MIVTHRLGDLGKVPGGNAWAPGKEHVAVCCVQPVRLDLSASQRVVVVWSRQVRAGWIKVDPGVALEERKVWARRKRCFEFGDHGMGLVVVRYGQVGPVAW